jgi:putative SOS response-associated peptidase YedK
MNARGETIGSKSTFSRLVTRHRCVVLVDGFFEWYKYVRYGEQKKQPYYASPIDNSATLTSTPGVLGGSTASGTNEQAMVHLAALWDQCIDPATNTPLYTFTIITCDAPKHLKWYIVSTS